MEISKLREMMMMMVMMMVMTLNQEKNGCKRFLVKSAEGRTQRFGISMAIYRPLK